MSHYADFKTNDPRLVFGVIAEYPFAMICKNSAEGSLPDIINAPVIFSENGRTLEFHFARGNAAWENIAAGGLVKLIFNGPNTHISPAWYKDRFAMDNRSKTAPTWDYVQAVVTGALTRMNEAELTAHLQRLVMHFEGTEGWRFSELATDTLQDWQKYIGGFTLAVTSAEAIFKLSQEQRPADQLHIVEALMERGQGDDKAIAEFIARSLTFPSRE